MSLFHIPLHVKASSPQELEKEMLRVQAKDGITYKFFAILRDEKLDLYTGWYYGDASLRYKDQIAKLLNPPKVSNGIKKNDIRS